MFATDAGTGWRSPRLIVEVRTEDGVRLFIGATTADEHYITLDHVVGEPSELRCHVAQFPLRDGPT